MIYSANLSQIGTFKPMIRLIFIMFLLLPCVLKAQPQAVPVRFLQDYYYLGTAPLSDGVNAFVVTSRKEFKKLFGETKRPDTPDFSKEWMIVLLMPKTKWDAKIDIKDISMKAGSFIEVYTKVFDGIHKLTYDNYPIRVAVIPRYKNINNVNFYDGKRLRPLANVVVE